MARIGAEKQASNAARVEAAISAIVGGAGPDVFINLVDKGAATLIPHMQASLHVIVPRLVGGQAIQVNTTEDGLVATILRTVDNELILVSALLNATERLIGFGARSLPRSARPWPGKDTPVGVAAGSIVKGFMSMSVSGYRQIDPMLPVTVETSFRAGSIAKVVTAAGILLLDSEGALSLNDPVWMHLPVGTGAGSAWSIPSIRDVLGHRGGFPRERRLSGGSSDSELPVDFRDCYDMTRLGALQYSNVGYEILGWIIANCTGVAATEWLRYQVLDPLGLLQTGFSTSDEDAVGYRVEYGYIYEDNDDWIAPTAGGLVTTIVDLVALGGWIAGTVNAQTRQTMPTGIAEHLLREELGMFRKVSDSRIRVFGGSRAGFQTGLAVLPEEGAVGILVNTGGCDAVQWATEMAEGFDSLAVRALPST